MGAIIIVVCNFVTHLFSALYQSDFPQGKAESWQQPTSPEYEVTQRWRS